MPRLRPRSGFTIVEVLVSMVILLVIIAVTVQTFTRSSNLLAAQGGRLEAQQNARFAMTSIDRDLRVAGVGVVADQPLIVEAANTAIVFNVDLISRLPGDPGAVYVDTSADSNATNVWQSVNKLLLPGLSTYYPQSTYVSPTGVPSGAETIAYYLSPDTTSSLANTYVLYRRVNATTPAVVARGILYNSGDTVFQYSKVDTTGKETPIPITSLPLYHKATIHGSPADTGKYALVDSINLVTVKLKAVYNDPKLGVVKRPLITTIRIMNSGLNQQITCGDPPLGVTVTDSTSPAGSPTPFVTVMWNASADDGGGEKDVKTYTIYRRTPGSTFNISQPFASVPAGSANYSFTDNNVASGDQWVYGVAAQDCTPSNSPIGKTGTVVVP
ncbi:MAG: prepilin-type N-terminal cleavage/methylation domain-containing protein [Gemmatimonadota bacterium]|nr:prepilin-type N-terminal cleavage/methylation domain-containing protein [Gemmatimonadota bacterium]MDE3171627.1 prepilin-type N-terminal cleavage/methylation domain-containing protein [Gemmatimonadota bacterium]MDE3215013.1 prepilin-type N-terminal cleavage/methylation domain-containing protein [Gemmatimonadota bacterium]